jgi:hypothetical protein
MTASTLEPVDGVEVDPEVVALIERIDTALRDCTGRSLVSSDEVADLLLDIRAAATALTGR